MPRAATLFNHHAYYPASPTMAFSADDTYIRSLLESRCSLLIILLRNTLVSLREELLCCAPRDVVLQHSLVLSRMLRMCHPLAKLLDRKKERIRSQTDEVGADTGRRRTSLPFSVRNSEPSHAMTSLAHVENIMLSNQLFLSYSAPKTPSGTDNNQNFMRPHSSLCTDISTTIVDAILSETSQSLVLNDPQRSKVNNSHVPAKSTEAIALTSLSTSNETKSVPNVLRSMSGEFLLSTEHANASRMTNRRPPPSALTASSTGTDGSYRGNCEKNEATICSSKSLCLSALLQGETGTTFRDSSARIICSARNDRDRYSCESLLLKEDDMFIPPRYSVEFQRRTYYRGKAVDERRNPCAPWASNPMPHTPNSLSVNASVNSLDTLDSLPSQISQTPIRYVHSNKSNTSHSRARGYSNFRRDDDPRSYIWGLSVHVPQSHRSTSRGILSAELSNVTDSFRRTQTVSESTSFVRLRDQVFEIGIDGRIRKQHLEPTRDRRMSGR